jgi:hypothetical protein
MDWATLYGMNGYIDGLRITNGIARYTASFTPPTQEYPAYGGYNDPYFASTSLLLHMNGSNNSTTFTDSSLNALAVTANGNAQISTAQSMFGGASAAFDGTGDYLSIAHNSIFSIESGDFTAEAWVYRNTSGAIQNILNKRVSTPASGYGWRINANNTLQYFFLGGSSITSTSTVGTGTWIHVAVTRSGNTVRQFINGTLDATTVTFSNGTSNTQEMRIGVDELAADGLNGYIDDLRITKGIARYTANFTPPAAPFPDA